jgi:molecular chaperone GrpE
MQNNDPYSSDGVPADGQFADEGNPELQALQGRVAELEASNAELRETVLREHAELENQRRRLHRDLEQARRFANEKLLGELLPVYDGLESGLAIEGGDVTSMREGLGLTLKALLKVAENHGMAQDPERHHAVSMVDAAGHAPGTVVAVLQKGYVLNDRLLRPALVAVAKD